MIPTPRPGPRFGDCPECGGSTCDCRPIVLLAAASDGWAFAHQDGQAYLLRPPFGDAHRYPHSFEQMHRVLRRETYATRCLAFSDWGSIEDHLRQLIEDNAGAATGVPSLRLLARATDEQINRHLDRMESKPASASTVPILDALASSPHASPETLARIEVHRTPLAVAEKDAVEQVELDRCTHAGGPRIELPTRTGR